MENSLKVDQPQYVFFSLGYRCSSASILKKLGIKFESHPFDWIVSRPPIIEHCISDRFREFFNTENYEKKQSTTNHYESIDSTPRKIVDENIFVNKYYENYGGESSTYRKYYVAPPLTTKYDTYAHQLVFNHHDITSPSDRAYYRRCVERWDALMASETTKKCGLYIHPCLFCSVYVEIERALINELRRFHKSLRNRNIEGIYIIPVKLPYPSVEPYVRYVLEEQPDSASVPNCRICVLWVNQDFIDAGEIFMGNSSVETAVVMDYVYKTYVNKGLLPISG